MEKTEDKGMTVGQILDWLNRYPRDAVIEFENVGVDDTKPMEPMEIADSPYEERIALRFQELA